MLAARPTVFAMVNYNGQKLIVPRNLTEAQPASSLP